MTRGPGFRLLIECLFSLNQGLFRCSSAFSRSARPFWSSARVALIFPACSSLMAPFCRSRSSSCCSASLSALQTRFSPKNSEIKNNPAIRISGSFFKKIPNYIFILGMRDIDSFSPPRGKSYLSFLIQAQSKKTRFLSRCYGKIDRNLLSLQVIIGQVNLLYKKFMK